MKFKDYFHINTTLLPFKLHFFFVCAGYAGVVPFMPIIAKELGINATAVGVGYSMIPIFTFVTNPVVGFFVDFFQNIKVFLAFILVVSTASYFSVLCIPAMNHELSDTAYVRVSHFKDSEPLLNISVPFERTCLKKLLGEDIDCKLGIKNDLLLSNNSDKSKLSDLINLSNFTYEENKNEKSNKSTDEKVWVTFYVGDISFPEMQQKMPSEKNFHCSPSVAQCALNGTNSVFSSYQFWMFIAFAITGDITGTSVMTLSSVGTCEILGNDVVAFGRQRLFGTIGWGLMCAFTGILNDISNPTGNSFQSGFFIMAIFIFIDMIILFKIHIPKANISSSMCKDLGKIFGSKEIVIFAFGIAFVGIFSSMISVYEFWFLQDMGANRTLLGLAIAMQCFVGEVPFLFFSGWFVKKLGYFLCFVGVFSGFAVRFLSYSVIKDPWLVLPIDILHGLTYGLYCGTMTSFAKEKAPKGMEATLLGIFGGLCDGLGCGLGSFLGGVGLDTLGARKTFLSGSMLSLGCLLAFSLLAYVFRSPTKKTHQVGTSETDDET